MTLIIAEKPSLARNIAAATGDFKKRDGYLENGEYIITWAFGHLFSLVDIESYGGSQSEKQGARWTLENLPCFPAQFRFELRRGSDKKVDAGVKKQFETIKALCRRSDVDVIVNAGDADREGEIIVRLCVINTRCGQKRFMRLWLPDQTPQTVRSALDEMKSESEYDCLADEGFARTYIDWLYGVNLTRLATIKSGTLLRVGRVIVPIVRAIYERDMEIKNFKPVKYYALVSSEKTNGEVVELVSKKKFDADKYGEAEKTCDLYNATDAVVTDVKRKKDSLFAGKLYSLSKLQSVLGKKFKMSMSESLEIVQKLYEQGYLTYPRTNSEYLATAEQGKIKDIITQCGALGYPVEFKFNKTIFDDSKIESHSAITPTYKIPKKGQLAEREFNVYSTVFRRFVAVFCSQPCIVEKSEITIALGDLEVFTLKGMIMKEPGWTKYDDYTAKDKILPELAIGDRVVHVFKPTEKETTSPKHYTIETLNNYLKNPFKDDKKADDGDDSEEYRAIFEGLELGTEATRTGIIDNARKSGYIQLANNVYTILPGGIYMIEALSRLGITMDKYKTSELGRALKKVYRGEIAVCDSVTLAQKEIAGIFAANPATDADIPRVRENVGESVGKCPKCGGEVKVSERGYGCENCKFVIYGSMCRRDIGDEDAKALLTDGKTGKLGGFISKRGNPFDAALKISDGRVVFDFPDAPKNEEKGSNTKSAKKTTAKRSTAKKAAPKGRKKGAGTSDGNEKNTLEEILPDGASDGNVTE